MKINYKLMFFTIVILFSLLAACSDSANTTNESDNQTNSVSDGSGMKIAEELNVAYNQQPPTLDTYVNTSRPTTDIAKHIFETLVTTDSNYEIQPMLADSWEQSEDGKTITFQLREGIKFHNGEEMTADDVVVSMNSWIEVSSMGKEYFSGAVFEKVDDYTVDLLMKEPTSTALLILGYGGGNLPGIMPASIRENAPPEGVDKFIGTGPFKLEEWKQDQHIHMKRFEEYQPREEEPSGLAGKREALVENLYFLFVSDSMTATSGLRTGEYDVAYGLTPENIDNLKGDDTVESQVYPSGILNAVFNKKKGLFSNVKAREAVVIGTNKEAILKSAYSSEEYYKLTHNIMPEYTSALWSSEIGKEIYEQYDIERSKKLLEESGYNGEEVTIIVSREGEYYNGAVVLDQQLKELGINSKLEVYDWATLNEVREDENNYDILFLNNTDKPEPTAHVFFRDDWPGWTESEELDVIMEKFRRAPSLDAAKEYYDDLQKWYYEYFPILKAGDINSSMASRTAVKNVTYTDGIILWNVSKND